jgi:hypothetical protein
MSFFDYTDVKPLTPEELAQALNAREEMRASERAAKQKLTDEGRCVHCGALFVRGIEQARMTKEEAKFFNGLDYFEGDFYCAFCWFFLNAEPNDPDTWPEHGHA